MKSLSRTACYAVLLTGLLVFLFVIFGCVSARYIHREFYTPPSPAAAVNPVSFLQPDTYTPSPRGNLKSETIIEGQDSRDLVHAANGEGGGVFGSLMGLIPGGGELAGAAKAGGIGGVLLMLQGLLGKRERNRIRTTADTQYDEAYQKGYQAGVAAGARGNTGT